MKVWDRLHREEPLEPASLGLDPRSDMDKGGKKEGRLKLRYTLIWTRYSVSLCLHFLVYYMGMIILPTPTSQNDCEN